jgi:acyl carrier protein
MNNASDIAEQLRQEIATRARLEADQVKPDAHFVLDMGMSSLDLLSVLAFAEKSFGARFPDEILADLTTLNKVDAAVREYQNQLSEPDE